MNPNRASFGTEGTYTPDGLIVDGKDIRGKVVTLITGQNVTRGTVLGKITDGAVTAVGAADVPAPVAATITASPTATTAAMAGVHRFVCVTAGATGKWRHYNPAGEVIGDATTGTEYTGGGLTLTITDAGTDPAVGEAFKVTVTIAAGSNKFKTSVAAATDGSETPDVIAAEDVDATSADKDITVYYTGDFDSAALTLGAGHTAASIADGLRAKGIHLHTSVPA